MCEGREREREEVGCWSVSNYCFSVSMTKQQQKRVGQSMEPVKALMFHYNPFLFCRLFYQMVPRAP